MIKTPAPSVNEVAINTRKLPLSNVHIRRAISYALDRQKLIALCFPGYKMAAGYVPPGLGGYNPEIKTATYDIEKAQEEIKLSGLSKNEIARPILLIRPDNHACAGNFASFFESSLKRIGMNVTVKHLPLDALFKIYYNTLDYDMISWNTSGEHPEAFFVLNNFYSNHPDNYTGFKSRSYDEVVSKVLRAEDRYERFNLYKKLQEIIQQEVPTIPLYYNMYESIYQHYIRGVGRSPYSRYVTTMKTIYFENNGNGKSVQ